MEEFKKQIIKELLDHEGHIAQENGIDRDTIQSWKREYFIENDALHFELEKLKSTMQNLKYLKPLLYKKMLFTGELFQVIARTLLEKTQDQSYLYDNTYIIASFYCNIGFLGLEQSLYRNKYTTDADIELIKRHVYIGSHLMQTRKLDKVANIIKLHHEKPDGSGYLKEQITTDKVLGVLNIADEFVDAYLPFENKPESPLTFEEAINHAYSGYQSHTMFKKRDLDIIKEIIKNFIEEKKDCYA